MENSGSTIQGVEANHFESHDLYNGHSYVYCASTETSTDQPALNYSENLASNSPNRRPWLMEGSFLNDRAVFRGLSIQEAMWHCCSLRLAIMYDAPIETQLDIIAKGTPHTAAAASLIYGPEWDFHSALTLIRSNPDDARIEQACETLRKVSGSQ